jgi:hypothetical protein
MEVKDDIIARLNEEMVKKESQLRNEVSHNLMRSARQLKPIRSGII